MEQDRETALVPVRRQVPRLYRARALRAVGTRAIALATHSPVVRRAAALGLATGLGYWLDRALQTARPLPPEGGRRLERTERQTEPTAVRVWYSRVTVTRVYRRGRQRSLPTSSSRRHRADIGCSDVCARPSRVILSTLLLPTTPQVHG